MYLTDSLPFGLAGIPIGDLGFLSLHPSFCSWLILLGVTLMAEEKNNHQYNYIIDIINPNLVSLIQFGKKIHKMM